MAWKIIKVDDGARGFMKEFFDEDAPTENLCELCKLPLKKNQKTLCKDCFDYYEDTEE